MMGIVLIGNSIVVSSRQQSEQPTTARESTPFANLRCGVLESAWSPNVQKAALWRPLASKWPSAKSFVFRKTTCK